MGYPAIGKMKEANGGCTFLERVLVDFKTITWRNTLMVRSP